MRDWSMSRAFTGAALPRSAPASCDAVSDGASTPEPRLVGIELDAAEAPRVAHGQGAAAGEGHGEAVPRRLVAVGGVLEVVEAGGAVDDQPAGHAEAQAERRARRVEQQQLADATSVDDPLPDQHRRLGAALEEPRIVGDDGGDGAADDPLGEAAVHLHLDQLRHRTTFAQVPADIRIDDIDGVRTVTLGPARARSTPCRSSCGTAPRDALRSAADADVRCIVVTGTGRAFTVGQDLAEMADPRQADPERGFRGLLSALVDLDVPLLAAVNGMAVGFGTTLLPWCDVAVAGSSARFRVPFVSLGVTTEAGSSVTLPAVMGRQAAARFVLTGEWLSADDACAAGLVAQVVPDEELLPTVQALAAQIAAQPPTALRATTRLLHAGRTAEWSAAVERENAVFAELAGGPENLAAIERFFTKS